MRLFTALVPSEDAVAHLDDFLEPRRPSAEAFRWSRPEQFHITLAFMGDAPAHRVDDYVGTATTGAVKVRNGAKLKAKARTATVHGRLVAEVQGSVKVTGVKKSKARKLASGRIVVREGDVVVGKGKVRHGVFTRVLKGITAGRHELTVDYLGNKSVAAATSTEKLKV